MNQRTIEEPNKVKQETYEHGLRKFSLFLVFIFLVLAGFILNFPLFDQITAITQKQLKRVNNSVSFDSIDYKLFMPKVIVNGLTIKQPGQMPIKIQQLNIAPLGPSFSPVGINLKTEGIFKGFRIGARVSIGLKEQKIQIDEEKLNIQKLLKASGQSFNLRGDFDLNMVMALYNQKVKSANFRISSNNLIIPAQKIMVLDIPAQLKIGKVNIKGNINNKSVLKITNGTIGGPTAPVRGGLSGTIKINQNNPHASSLNLKLQVALSDRFLALPGMSMLSMFLNPFPKKDGFYQIKISGTLAQPRTSAL